MPANLSTRLLIYVRYINCALINIFRVFIGAGNDNPRLEARRARGITSRNVKRSNVLIDIIAFQVFKRARYRASVCVCVRALQGCARLINYPLLLGRGREEIDEALLPIEPTEL